MSDTADITTLGMTESVCPVCCRVVAAKVLGDASGVYFLKFCPDHGERRERVYSNVDDYLRTLRYVKPAWIPMEFAGDASRRCPEGCGFCKEHEQHLCMPIVEITQRCDLACPICINSSGEGENLSPAQFSRILDGILAAEKQVDVLNLSGGEPLLHPQLLELIDDALGRDGIVRVSISTNGLPLLRQPALLDELRERDVVVSLQFDGFDDNVYRQLRGRPLLREKEEILDLLKGRGMATSLTMTAAGGVSEGQFRPILDYLFNNDHVISLMIQPLAFTGRGSDASFSRLFIPDIVRSLGEAGHPSVTVADFVPLPCSHPLCFSLAFYLCLEEGGTVAMNRLTDADTLLDSLANRVVFGLDAAEQERMRELIYELWSGPAGAVPDGKAVLKTIKGILRDLQGQGSGCSCFDPRKAFSLTERKVKSIFIHAFQDTAVFDLARVRRCCQAYPQADGRLLPACVHNDLRRQAD